MILSNIVVALIPFLIFSIVSGIAVSYTHLDVYKRQISQRVSLCTGSWCERNNHFVPFEIGRAHV